MQKVEGSSPFIRFSEPLETAGFSVPDRGGAEWQAGDSQPWGLSPPRLPPRSRPRARPPRTPPDAKPAQSPPTSSPARTTTSPRAGAEEFLLGQLPAFVHLPAIVLTGHEQERAPGAGDEARGDDVVTRTPLRVLAEVDLHNLLLPIVHAKTPA